MPTVATSHRSVRAQALHYLARPHTRVPTAPIESPAAWTRADVDDPARWTDELSPADVAELEVALERSVDIPLPELRADAFPLPRLAPRIAQWRTQVYPSRHAGSGYE